MKIAIVLLLVALVAVQDTEGWRFWRRVKNAVKRVVNVVKRVASSVKKVVRVWNTAKKIWETVKTGKRDVNSLDLNGDGHVDIDELSKMVDERDARDLIESMSDSSGRVSVQEFERNLRDLSELTEEDIYNQFKQ
ncbi:uncharacterized protein LOC121377744 [Gigantopelta aegis]|uniref:uncharacterized protein LOC121377744 n=1 Tax=Gigantopelta aegis TaxID=1735272 RepID=UPI001B88BF24|nr:uncharacterized protein LOC121377744 [Gigantopelta aegis]